MESDMAMQSSFNLGLFERFADGWVACLREILQSGSRVTDNGEPLRELLNVTVSGRTCTQQDFLEAGAEKERIALMIRKYGSLEILPEYKVSYGSLFWNHKGVDQVDWLIRRLKAKRETKSATIGFHVPGENDLSCVSLVDCKIRDGILYFNCVFRSQNIFGSQPGNICALDQLQRKVSGEVGVSQGPLTLHILSAHVYEKDLDRARGIVFDDAHCVE